MSEHTPGPWKVERIGRRYDVVSEGGIVCALAQWTPAVDEADARLIAAAPDLLETLECIAAITSDHEIRELAHAAIAKATGSSTVSTRTEA
jgi:hypothetical protein